MGSEKPKNVDRLNSAEQKHLRKEFVDLYEVSGWNQVRCAEELSITQGYVSRILSGLAVVEKPIISHFKVKLAGLHPSLLRGETGEHSTRPNVHQRVIAPSEETGGKNKSDDLDVLRDKFEALVKSDPESALALNGVITYLSGGKKKKKGKAD